MKRIIVYVIEEIFVVVLLDGNVATLLEDVVVLNSQL